MQRISIALVLALSSACAATSRDAETSDYLREIERAETERPAPVERIAREASAPTSTRGAALQATGTPLVASYTLRDARDGATAKFEAVRCAARMRVRGSGQDWYFERNPVAHEEVVGFLVDTHRETLIEYPSTDLAVEGYARSWSALARLGVDPTEIGAMRATGEHVEAFGVTFALYVDDAATGGELRELAWSDAHQIPLRFARASGLEVRVDALDLDVKSDACSRAVDAHPSFAVQDVADWREGLHDH